ncbi:unnamed protein product [Prorocentrum cordatum]|uniref:Uncharacterized protein n=1 Tax=Prorocentrum cordatum TaxID=2364126 RepID=A0ABN9R113_9DINO|nr:unnamed protein product [Polarella glacialis]
MVDLVGELDACAGSSRHPQGGGRGLRAGRADREIHARLGVECLGLDVDPAAVGRAQRAAGASVLADAGGPAGLSFAACDVRSGAALAAQLRPGDLVVGLHPCGSLGERVVSALQAAAGDDAVTTRARRAPQAAAGARGPLPSPGAVVSCCLHGKPEAPVEDPSRRVPRWAQSSAWRCRGRR